MFPQPTSLFSLNPTPLQQQQQLQQQQATMQLPTLQSPQPYARDTQFIALPESVRTSLESLEKSLRCHSHLSKYLEDRDYSSVSETCLKLAKLKEKVGQVEVKMESTKTAMVDARRMTGLYWRYGESVAASLSVVRQAPASNDQPKYSPTFQLPPLDLHLFERIIDRLDGQYEEAHRAAINLREELEHRVQTSSQHQSLLQDIYDALDKQLKAVKCMSLRCARAQVDLSEDRKDYRRFLMKYRNDSRDPFPTRKSQ